MIRRWIGKTPKGRPQTWYLFTICVFGKRTQGIQGISKIQWIQSLQFFFRLADASTGTSTGGMGGSARRVEGFTVSPVRRYSRFLSFFWFFVMFIMMHLCRIHVVWRVNYQCQTISSSTICICCHRCHRSPAQKSGGARIDRIAWQSTKHGTRWQKEWRVAVQFHFLRYHNLVHGGCLKTTFACAQ